MSPPYAPVCHLTFNPFRGFLAGGPTAADAVEDAKLQATKLLEVVIGPPGIPMVVRPPQERGHREAMVVAARRTHIVILEGTPADPKMDRASLCYIAFSNAWDMPPIDVTDEEWAKLSVGWEY